MLVFCGRNPTVCVTFGLGDLVGINAAHTHALLMDVQHDLRGFITILLKDVLQERRPTNSIGRVIVVQHQHTLYIDGFLVRVLVSVQRTAAALALARFPSSRPRRRACGRDRPGGSLGPAQSVAVEAPFRMHYAERPSSGSHPKKSKPRRNYIGSPSDSATLGRKPILPPPSRFHWFDFQWLGGAFRVAAQLRRYELTGRIDRNGHGIPGEKPGGRTSRLRNRRSDSGTPESPTYAVAARGRPSHQKIHIRQAQAVARRGRKPHWPGANPTSSRVSSAFRMRLAAPACATG